MTCALASALSVARRPVSTARVYASAREAAGRALERIEANVYAVYVGVTRLGYDQPIAT